MESDATTDPVVQEFFVDAFNAEHDDIELEVVFKEDINDKLDQLFFLEVVLIFLIHLVHLTFW